MIKTIFFDVGSVILNEDYLHFKLFEVLWTLLRKYSTDWTFARLMQEREKRIERLGDPRPDFSIAKEYLSANDFKTFQYYVKYIAGTRRHTYLREMPGIRYVIHNLAHYYQLGIIANQPEQIVGYLKHRGLLNYFRVLGISDVVGYRKPDKALFQWALQQARSEPENCVMIGDRIDHDVLPARSLGMRTILARFTLKARGILPQNDRERLYFESLMRVPNWPQEPRHASEVPDAVVEAPAQIISAIQQMEHGSVPQESETLPQKSFWQSLREFIEMLEKEIPD